MYQEFKFRVVELTGLSRDAIHIYVGLFVFFSFIAVFRKGKVEPVALIPVLFITVSMEIVDLYDNFRTMDSMYWGNSVHDLVNTVLWPVVIVLLVRFNRAFRHET
jgi:uncharacterized membrane protein